MIFEGITINGGHRVIGFGVARSTEKNVNGREVMYLFTDSVEWVDGSEFCVPVSSFEFVYADTVKVIE